MYIIELSLMKTKYNDENLIFLEEYIPPDDFQVVNIPYIGNIYLYIVLLKIKYIIFIFLGPLDN